MDLVIRQYTISGVSVWSTEFNGVGITVDECLLVGGISAFCYALAQSPGTVFTGVYCDFGRDVIASIDFATVRFFTVDAIPYLVFSYFGLEFSGNESRASHVTHYH